MSSYLAEFVAVLAYSKKALLAIVLGLFFFAGINLLGDFMASRVHELGVMSALYERIENRYDKVAMLALVSFIVLAVKSFIRDRRRLYSML